MTDAGVRIVLTRWSPLMAIGVLAVTAVLAAGPLLALLDADTVTERIVMAVFTAVFAAPLAWTLCRIPKMLRGMGILVDHIGIHPFDGKDTDTIAWPEIARVGFKTSTIAGLEVYRKGDREPSFRYAISPYGKDAERVEHAVRRSHPELWAGSFSHER